MECHQRQVGVVLGGTAVGHCGVENLSSSPVVVPRVHSRHRWMSTGEEADSGWQRDCRARRGREVAGAARQQQAAETAAEEEDEPEGLDLGKTRGRETERKGSGTGMSTRTPAGAHGIEGT